MVFLGTITKQMPTPDTRIIRYRMRIDRAYKGVTEKEVTLLDDGMCGGPTFTVGEQYLMYTRRYDEVDLAARGCTRSTHIRSAEEDLKYLEGLDTAAPTGAVFGRVASWPEGPVEKVPLRGAMVHLQGSEQTVTTIADSTGRYSFDDLKPGKYAVSADQLGFHMPVRDYGLLSAVVEARGCARIDVNLSKDWPGTIAGRLVRSDGYARGGRD
jgi:hypothetical protein